MSTIDIDALRALVEAATPGEWFSDTCDGATNVNDGVDWVAETRIPHDAAFIAAARTALPALLDEVERLRNAHDLEIEVHDQARSRGYEYMKRAEAAEAEVARLRAELGTAYAIIESKDLIEDTHKIDRLRAALRRYGIHRPTTSEAKFGCGYYHGLACSCGLAAALADDRPTTGEP